MPIISARTRGKRFLRHVSSLEDQNNETLHAYAAFIGEPPNYVLNQLIDKLLATDAEYVTWRERHPESFVPVRHGRQRRRRTRPEGRPRERADMAATAAADVPPRET